MASTDAPPTSATSAPQPAPARPRRSWFPLPGPGQLAALVVALCFLSGAAGWALAQDRPPSRGSADVGFLYDMSAHHEGALTLAAIELERGVTEDVRTFASEITRSQSYEIGLMDAWLDHWGYAREDRPPVAMGWMGHEVFTDEMPGMATDEQLEALRAAEGTDADALFVALMIDHHRAGAEMAEAAVDAVDDGYVRDLAERMARVQRLEVQEMEAALGRAGLPLVDTGADAADHG
jgi:uncharacterized protein (DUF305 family)